MFQYDIKESRALLVPEFFTMCYNYLFRPQLILAVGNYMNSSKRGAVYGFKLQSLDMVSMHYVCTRVGSTFCSVKGT